MLKVGTQDIAKIYCGGTAIKKVYAGSDLVWPTAQPLPYDAELEWIETDGETSYIDTGIHPKWDLTESSGFDTSRVIVEFQFMNSVESIERNYQFAICGARDGTGGTSYPFGIANNITSGKFITRIPNVVATSVISVDNNRHVVSIGTPDVIMDGTSIQTSSMPSQRTPGSFMLGCSGDPSLFPIDGNTYHASKVRIYSCQIITDGVLVFDGIPVRVDTEGAIYDKVSKRLLRNAGSSGIIVPGPRVN